MRVTTLIRELLGVTGLIVDGFRFEPEGFVVEVRPRHFKARCGKCGKRAPGYDRRDARRWRHLGLGALKIWLEYAPRRVQCRRCGHVVVEKVPWAPHGGRFTWDFEELVAYLVPLDGCPADGWKPVLISLSPWTRPLAGERKSDGRAEEAGIAGERPGRGGSRRRT